MKYRDMTTSKKSNWRDSLLKNKQDLSTRNDPMDPETSEVEEFRHRKEQIFSKTIKENTAHYKTPARNGSVNQTPKLIGLSKLVRLL
jgi:hypothetical protein